MEPDVEILVAEDSPTQAEHVEHLLSSNGYKVTIARNGKQALAAARHRKPTLIISDVVMPEMDGFALCKHIKSSPELRDIPVILVTSLSAPQDVVNGLVSGADNFIRKPFDEKYLLARIRYVLSTRELRKRERVQLGVGIYFQGEEYFVNSDRQQILDLLISTYEEAVHINEELERRQGELASSYEILNGLYRVAADLNEALSPEQVIENTLDRVMEFPSVRAGWIYVMEAGGVARLAGSRGEVPGTALSDADAPCACLQEQHPDGGAQAQNMEDCERLRRATAGWSHAAVALRVGGHKIGVLSLLAEDGRAFTNAELKVLHGIGNQVAAALQRAQLHANLEKMVEARTAALQAEIAERKSAEEALRRSEQELRALVENAPYGIHRASLDGRFLSANPALVSTLGYASERELLALNLVRDVYVHPEDCAKLLQQCAERPTWKDIEVRWRRREGWPIILKTSGRVAQGQDGEPGYLEVMSEDVTERRSLEDQLRQSQKMEAVGRLAGGVAHDFNNLLGVILGYSELLLDKLAPDDTNRRKAEQIKEAAQRATSVTGQLLAFSRKQVLEPQIISINEVIAGIQGMLLRLLGENVQLVVKPDAQLRPVKADPGQLGQVIMNLAINARDAMPSGGKLTIETSGVVLDGAYSRTHVASAEGPFILLAVSDTGCGMDAETQSHIFEPFYTTKPKGKGTGLGLSTVYGIVKQSGGFIWVYSELGRGTTFKVYLPQVEGAPSSARRSSAAEELPLGSETVLVAEDEPMLRSVTCEFLRSSGYTVLEAGNGPEALRVAAEHAGPLHLMVTDVAMPGMSGRALAERLARLRPETKVLYVSGYTDDVILEHGVLGADTAYLPKPFTKLTLARKVRAVLGAGSPVDSLSTDADR